MCENIYLSCGIQTCAWKHSVAYTCTCVCIDKIVWLHSHHILEITMHTCACTGMYLFNGINKVTTYMFLKIYVFCLVARLYHQFTKVAVKHGKALCAINVLKMAINKYRSAPNKLTSLHADLAQVSCYYKMVSLPSVYITKGSHHKHKPLNVIWWTPGITYASLTKDLVRSFTWKNKLPVRLLLSKSSFCAKDI